MKEFLRGGKMPQRKKIRKSGRGRVREVSKRYVGWKNKYTNSYTKPVNYVK